MFSSNEALETTKQQRYMYDIFYISQLITNYNIFEVVIIFRSNYYIY